MATDGLSIEMLPADHGDALWIEWGGAGDRHRILIDGGTKRTFDTLAARFEALDADDRAVDLMIVSHIDADHIDGSIELLRDRSLGVTFGDVWFNDHHHLTGEPPMRGAFAGEFLGLVMEERGHPWNNAFDGGPVVVPPTGPLPEVPLDGGLRLVLLSPTPEKLVRLGKAWEKTLAEARMTPGDRAAIEKRMGPVDAERGGPRFGADSSAANGSSIAVIAEYGDERWLLAADAHEKVLLAGLNRYAAQEGIDGPVRFDGFKVAHHGSVNNITPALLQAIDCRRFLISTNGAQFHHPDEACIDLIIRHADRPELVFNYPSEYTDAWKEPSAKYTSTYGPSAGTGDGGRSVRTASAPEPTPSALDADDARAEDDLEEGKEGIDEESTGGSGESDSGPRVKVTVHHGSLDRADHPVLVGHYLATALAGAEGYVDYRFDHRLTDRLERDSYPGAIGESVSISAPRRRHPAKGVLVVGLGEYGELTPSLLAETIRMALVRDALARADRDDSETVDLGISSVLLGGTGGQGLSIHESVRALIEGVRGANRTLAAGTDSPRARYTKVQIFERNAAEAELTFHALIALGDASKRDGWGAGVDLPDRLEIAGGRLEASLPVDTSVRPWWRVRVSEVRSSGGEADLSPGPYIELEFAVATRMARTGSVIHRVERRTLERMLRSSFESGTPDQAPHVQLFELLFPKQLKWDLMSAQDIQLEVDPLTADLPWEMLSARGPGRRARHHLALRARLVRQLALRELPSVTRATRAGALVIGNPPVGRRMPTLPGAYEEAKAVEAVLEGPYSVRSLCFEPDEAPDPGTTARIEKALVDDDYRIIHIAGHGMFQPDDPTRTGVVIGPDEFITADRLGNLNVIPDVVFLNCCHLGNVVTGVQRGDIDFTRRNYNRLAASLARQLIDSGVRAVVAAGWAVHDGAAKAFARKFYEQMLGGATFGDAVHEARNQAFQAAPSSSTWGAYQCYGDGGYRLPRESASGAAREPVPPRTVRETLRWLEGLINRVESIGVEAESGRVRRDSEDDLKRFEDTARKKGWFEKRAGRLCEQFGRAWAAMGEHEKAIDWYERALEEEDGQMTLKGVEQLANLNDRIAARLVRNGDATPEQQEEAAKRVAEARRLMGLLAELGQTGERTALHAGHHKRIATTMTGAERVEEVGKSAEAYLASYTDHHDPYTLFNYVQLEEIRSRLAGEGSAAATRRGEVEEAIGKAERKLQSEGDYWSAVAFVDGQLTLAIMDDTIESRWKELSRLYEKVFDTRSTASQRLSTLDHLLDLAVLHPDEKQSAFLRSLYDSLEGG